jgi:glutamine synthetase adenylyltransferase
VNRSAGFALINSQLDPHVVLARFRRRELLRTYLHDIRRSRTIVETTDELSSIADTVLEYALKLCRQELDNRPRITADHRCAKPDHALGIHRHGAWANWAHAS